MTENDRLDWLQLAFTPYVGAEGFLLLLQRFGSAKAALDAPAEQIGRGGAPQAGSRILAQRRKTGVGRKRAAEAALQWETQDGCRLLLLQDDDFRKC